MKKLFALSLVAGLLAGCATLSPEDEARLEDAKDQAVENAKYAARSYLGRLLIDFGAAIAPIVEPVEPEVEE